MICSKYHYLHRILSWVCIHWGFSCQNCFRCFDVVANRPDRFRLWHRYPLFCCSREGSYPCRLDTADPTTNSSWLIYYSTVVPRCSRLCLQKQIEIVNYIIHKYKQPFTFKTKICACTLRCFLKCMSNKENHHYINYWKLSLIINAIKELEIDPFEFKWK